MTTYNIFLASNQCVFVGLRVAKTISIAICLIVLFAVVEAYAIGYYVSTNGSDTNPGTEANPFRTPQKAATIVAAGDTVFIKAGTYGDFNIRSKHGEAGNLITFKPYNGENVIIDAFSNNYANNKGHVVVLLSSSYIELSGLKITDSNPIYDSINPADYEQGRGRNGIKATWTGVLDHSHHIRIIGNEIYRTGGHGIVTDFLSHFNEIISNNVHDVGMGKGYGTDGHGLYLRGDDNTIRSNTFNNCYSYGMQVWSSNAANRPDRNVVEKNIVSNCGHSNSYDTQGSGIVVGASGTDNIIQNNICYGNVRDGIQLYWGVDNTVISNNTSYDNTRYGINIVGDGGTIDGTIIRNNIAYKNNSGNYSTDSNTTNTITSNNLFGIDPLFTDAAGKDFSLISSSPAIDSGTNANAPVSDSIDTIRPQGLGYDIGAYEYTIFDLSAPNGFSIVSTGK